MAFLETKQDRVSFNCPRLHRIFEATVISTHAVTELEREQRQAGVPGVSDMLHMLRLEPHLQFLHHPTLNPPTHEVARNATFKGCSGLLLFNTHPEFNEGDMLWPWAPCHLLMFFFSLISDSYILSAGLFSLCMTWVHPAYTDSFISPSEL